jgi:hypothetical protein
LFFFFTPLASRGILEEVHATQFGYMIGTSQGAIRPIRLLQPFTVLYRLYTGCQQMLGEMFIPSYRYLLDDSIPEVHAMGVDSWETYVWSMYPQLKQRNFLASLYRRFHFPSSWKPCMESSTACGISRRFGHSQVLHNRGVRSRNFCNWKTSLNSNFKVL